MISSLKTGKVGYCILYTIFETITRNIKSSCIKILDCSLIYNPSLKQYGTERGINSWYSLTHCHSHYSLSWSSGYLTRRSQICNLINVFFSITAKKVALYLPGCRVLQPALLSIRKKFLNIKSRVACFTDFNNLCCLLRNFLGAVTWPWSIHVSQWKFT